MGKDIKYGEFTFPSSRTSPATMKDGGYAKGGQKKSVKREPEAMVRKEVALLRKSGAPKAPLTMIKEEMMEPTGMKKGGSAESKLKKHANMPAGKAHGPGAGNKLAKGGVPSYSKVPKFGQMK